jgi:UDP-N-acetylglucosamine 2-epimerase
MKSNINKLNVITIVGTRPEIVRLSRVIPALDHYCNHKLIHTGQNYDFELNGIFFNDLEIRSPDYFLEASGESGVETIANIISSTYKILKKEMPDAVLVLGDTNSCMSLLSAKRLKIPTFHMEAGNRCFDMRVPEEINRRLVDHLADVNLTYSTLAKDYLINEGLSPDLIIKTGSPMKEVLNFNIQKINKSNILLDLKLTKNQFFLVSAHREENIDIQKNFSNLIDMLNRLATEYNLPVIVSTHPRTQKKIDESKFHYNKKIKFLKPLNFTDYNKLQISSRVTLSDSGTITEESSILNFPALNIRETHERPEGMEEASVMMVGLNSVRMIQCIEILENQPRDTERMLCEVRDYDVNNVSEKIVRIIQSYTDYVNRVIWKNY